MITKTAKTYISTHSLTRRLTIEIFGAESAGNFNSQPHKEADVCQLFGCS